MSIFNKHILLTLLMVTLAACQSGPQQPAPGLDAEPVDPQSEAPGPVPEPVDVNQQRYQQAVAALKSGAADQALELLEQVSREAPDKPYVFTNLGLAYLQLQDREQAEAAFQRAIELDDDDAVAHNHLGILQRHQGRFDDARRSYLRAIDIDDDYAGAHLNLGILFDIYLQDLDKALKQYQKYQALISEADNQVAGWIVDIERRLKSGGNPAQG